MMMASHNMPCSYLWNETTNFVTQKSRVMVSITSGKGVGIQMCVYNNFNCIIVVIMRNFCIEVFFFSLIIRSGIIMIRLLRF